MKRIGTRIDICVCTFRRPELAATLKSIAGQRLPRGVSIRVIVSDNDDTPSAKALVDECAHWFGLPIQYVHSPARNISIARNACLDAVSGDYFAFIDDDETATESWLANLTTKARQSGADVVLGPVRARYEEQAPEWMKAGNFHETKPVWVKGEIRTGYSCNVLVKTGAPSVIGRRFDVARGKSGGEDTEFFDAVFASGGRIEFAPDAWVEEPVPENRACFSWLARRRFRSGQTHGGLLRRKSATGVVKQLPIAFAKCIYSLGSVFAPPFHEVSAKRALLRAALHAGAMTGLLGWRESQIYGRSELPNSKMRYR
ncbi:MAG: glycosyltransferase family 2 protein [Mesorhizobium sp.]